MTTTEAQDDDRCVRCKDVMHGDGRTLWHACFYAMNELPIPFKEARLFHANLDECELAKPPVTIDSKLPGLPSITLASATVRCSGELTPHGFFTLRVCKSCRSEWMQAITRWWEEPSDERESPGTGIFVREYGRNVELTEDEWRRRAGDREPVRYRRDSKSEVPG